MAASTFGAINIRVEMSSEGSAPHWDRPTFTTTRHIPGGNTDVTQVMGVGTGTMQLSLLLDDTEYAALTALLLTEAALVIGGVAYGNALLESLGSPVRYVSGWYMVAATFRETGA